MQVIFFLFSILSGQTSVSTIHSQGRTKAFPGEEPLHEIPPGIENNPHNGNVTPEQKDPARSASYVTNYSRLLGR